MILLVVSVLKESIKTSVIILFVVITLCEVL